MVSPGCAAKISARSVPAPKSPLFVTVSVLGTSRPSSNSSRGRKRSAAGRCCARLRGDRVDVRLGRQEKIDMMFLLSPQAPLLNQCDVAWRDSHDRPSKNSAGIRVLPRKTMRRGDKKAAKFFWKNQKIG